MGCTFNLNSAEDCRDTPCRSCTANEPARPIKFRAWDKEAKILFILGNGDTHDTFMFFQSGASYYNLQNGSGGEEYDLMQFTGLVDRNGREIYEGDIVTRFGKPEPGIITYEAPEFVLKKGKISLGLDVGPLEVIGNIYEKAESI